MQQSAYTSLISIDWVHEAHDNIRKVIPPTPLIKNYNLSEEYQCSIYLKREDLTAVRSFKIRGAFNVIQGLSKKERQQGIVCASAGNHAQGVAFACRYVQASCKIFMPTTTPKQKISKVRHFGGEGAEIILEGDNYDEAEKIAWAYAERSGSTFVHPFNDPKVIAGQGTIGKEILEELEKNPDYIIVPVGGGGLISGIVSYVKQVSPSTSIIGVESEGAAAMHQSFIAGRRVRLDKIDSFADGIAVKEVGRRTWEICKGSIDRIITIPEGKICSTILSLYNDEAIVVEPASAVAISALDKLRQEIKGKKVVVIVSGGNNDISRTAEIRERSLLYEGKKHYFIIRFPQRAGALREFLEVLGPDDDITLFEYTKKRSRETGPALVGIELKYREDYEPLLNRMKQRNINFLPINDDPTLFEMLL